MSDEKYKEKERMPPKTTDKHKMSDIKKSPKTMKLKTEKYMLTSPDPIKKGSKNISESDYSATRRSVYGDCNFRSADIIENSDLKNV